MQCSDDDDSDNDDDDSDDDDEDKNGYEATIHVGDQVFHLFM